MKIFLEGRWLDKAKKIEVRDPFDNSVIDTVPKADPSDVEKALAYAERGAKVMAKLTSYERWKILRTAADLKKKERSSPRAAEKQAERWKP
jgi:glyceraldehyde-3-phosphate dehydrogenase (NADP+)